MLGVWGHTLCVMNTMSRGSMDLDGWVSYVEIGSQVDGGYMRLYVLWC